MDVAITKDMSPTHGTQGTQGTQGRQDTSLGVLLAEHHHELDGRLAVLVRCAQGGDAEQLRGEWAAFERELLAHMELEETEILPAFAHHDPAAARAVLDEHVAIRAQLLEMGLHLDLHLLRADRVAALVEKLRAHARHEEAALYAWTGRHLPGDGRHMLAGALADAAQRRRGP
jgi:hypothetical protein